MDAITIFIIISLIAFILLLKGVIQAFKRNAIVAILCVILSSLFFYAGHLWKYFSQPK